jgi:hypothetical protein
MYILMTRAAIKYIYILEYTYIQMRARENEERPGLKGAAERIILELELFHSG